MIVRDPPYELVVVSADADTQKLLERLIERGCGGRDPWEPLAGSAGSCGCPAG
ncbi:MAG: hypothetical protein FJ087_00745 [Deltaproteobacteria bacterium]|nr:hypothetical protein [Deltaproteobacteria bacterium]